MPEPKKKSVTTVFVMIGMTLMLVGLAWSLPSKVFRVFSQVGSEQYRLSGDNNPRLFTPTPFQPLEVTKTPVSEPNAIPYISSTATPEPDQEVTEEPSIPVRIEIPGIELNAPVVEVEYDSIYVEGKMLRQYRVPEFYAAGWHADSARLGEAGNMVLNGHHNIYGEVFGRLVDVKVGDIVYVYSDDKTYEFVVAVRKLLPDAYENVETRQDNARWLAKTEDIRLTLVTCWPYDTSTHRLILVAVPAK